MPEYSPDGGKQAYRALDELMASSRFPGPAPRALPGSASCRAAPSVSHAQRDGAPYRAGISFFWALSTRGEQRTSSFFWKIDRYEVRFRIEIILARFVDNAYVSLALGSGVGTYDVRLASFQIFAIGVLDAQSKSDL